MDICRRTSPILSTRTCCRMHIGRVRLANLCIKNLMYPMINSLSIRGLSRLMIIMIYLTNNHMLHCHTQTPLILRHIRILHRSKISTIRGPITWRTMLRPCISLSPPQRCLKIPTTIPLQGRGIPPYLLKTFSIAYLQASHQAFRSRSILTSAPQPGLRIEHLRITTKWDNNKTPKNILWIHETVFNLQQVGSATPRPHLIMINNLLDPRLSQQSLLRIMPQIPRTVSRNSMALAHRASPILWLPMLLPS